MSHLSGYYLSFPHPAVSTRLAFPCTATSTLSGFPITGYCFTSQLGRASSIVPAMSSHLWGLGELQKLLAPDSF